MTDTIGGTGTNADTGANYQQSSIITASASGTLLTVGLNVETALGNVKVAIYADDGSNRPAARLGQSAGAAEASGWNDQSIPGSVAIVLGTKYHLAWDKDTAGAKEYYNASGTSHYLSKAYADAFTNPWGAYTTETASFNMRMVYSTVKNIKAYIGYVHLVKA